MNRLLDRVASWGTGKDGKPNAFGRWLLRGL